MTAIGPGIYDDMAPALYHGDPCEGPSLSSGIANLLLAKTPAHARLAHPRLNPGFVEPSTKVMDLGSVTHELLLGKGCGFEISPFDDYKSKAAREWRSDTVARGLIPILAADHENAVRMEDAVRKRVAQTPGT